MTTIEKKSTSSVIIEDFFKYLFSYVPFKRPINLLVGYAIFSKGLDDLAYWISYFLRFNSEEVYEKTVWNYDGLGGLLEDLFKYRDSFLDITYLVQNYRVVILSSLIIWALIRFNKYFSNFLSPGRLRSYYEKFSNFLWQPNKAVFFVFLFLFAYLLNGFFTSIYGSYLLSINERLSKSVNEYAETRSKKIIEKLEVDSKLKEPKPQCTFRVVENSRVFHLKYLDFIAKLFWSEEEGFKIIDEKIKQLPNDLELKVTDEAKSAQILDLKKETFTRSEVEKIIELDRKARELLSAVQEKNEVPPKQSLRIEFKGGDYKLYFDNSRERMFLGSVDFKCSRDAQLLILYDAHFLLNGLRFPR